MRKNAIKRGYVHYKQKQVLANGMCNVMGKEPMTAPNDTRITSGIKLMVLMNMT